MKTKEEKILVSVGMGVCAYHVGTMVYPNLAFLDKIPFLANIVSNNIVLTAAAIITLYSVYILWSKY